MGRFSFGSLRLRVILLVFLAILPLFGLTLYSNLQQRQKAKVNAEQDALRLARIAALQQEQLIESTQQLLIVLAQLPVVREGDAEECEAFFTELLAQYPDYSGFSVATPDGDVNCSAPPITTPVNFDDRSWFQKILKTKDFVVGEYLVGRISGKSIIVLAYPVLDASNNLQKVIAIGLDLSWLNGVITEADLPSGSAYTVIDRNGIVLARNPDPEQWVGHPATHVPIVDQILSQQSEGTLEAVGLDGVQRLYAYVPLVGETNPSTYVFIGTPRTVAYAEVNWVLVTNLIGLGLATAIALVIAWIGGYVFIVRRVDILVQATERLKAGDLSARTGLPDEIGELNQLGQAFDQMAEAMQAHDAEIQQANLSLRRANRALSVLSDCNQALIRTENEPDFLDEICRIIYQVGGYRLAWVGYAEDDEEKTVRPVAQAGGYEDGYFDTIHITWADTAEGRGPTGTAIRTGKPVIARDILNDPNFAPWREEALKRGYASSIALPLIENGRHLGALNIYTAEVDAFNPDEVTLLEELAMDLAFGIEMLRIRAQHQKAEEKIQIQLKNLSALRQIDMAISASLDLRVTLNVLLDQVCNTLGADAACMLLLQPHTQVFEFTAGRGFYTEALRHTSLRFGEGHAGLAALERRIVNIPDLFRSENGLQRSVLLSDEEFITYHAAPLVAKGKVKGVMEIFHRTHFEPDQEWLDFLDALAAQAAIAIENAALFDDVQRSNVELMMAYDTTLEGWSRALELRDHETEGHTKRVAKVTINLARALKIKEADLVHVHRGAILHDIGKMGIPDDILLKPGPLSEEEWKLMHQHPTLAFKLLSPIAYLRPALDIPYCHHEKWDGTGYPRGLKGEEIPITARIFAVVDVWDAVRSDRPYRKAWPEEKARAYIKEQAGQHFDSQVVEAFFRYLEEDQGARPEYT